MDSIRDSSITVGMIKMLKEKQEEFQNILAAVYQASSSTLAQAQAAYTLRLNEYNHFIQYKQNLQHLCHHLTGFEVKGD